jgi:hypothetical protein
MKKHFIGIVAALSVLLFCLPVTSQERKPSMRQEIVRLSYVSAGTIFIAVQEFKSPDGKLTIVSNTVPPYGPNVILLKDYPENVEKMLSIIKEIDVKAPDLLFTIQLILATEDGNAKTDDALLNDTAIKELRSFLKYKAFTLLDSSLMRAQNNGYSRTTMGPKGEFELVLRPQYSKKDKTEWIGLDLRLEQRQGLRTQKETQQEGNKTTTTEQDRMVSDTILSSNLTIKSGERTVVGVSRTLGGDKGLILIISGKII